MIEYSKTRADNKKRVQELTWMKGRLFMIAAICLFPVAVFLLLVGLFGSVSDALQMGIYSATLDVVLILMYALLYDKFHKAVTKNFESYEIDGKIDFTLERTDEDTLEFTRRTDEESFQVHKSDIKKKKQLKTIYVLILKDGRTVDLPRNGDVDELLNGF